MISLATRLSPLLAAALMLSAWAMALLGQRSGLNMLGPGVGATLSGVLALAWLTVTWRHARRGTVPHSDASVPTVLLLAAAMLLGLEAGAVARQSGVADGRLIAMVISLVLAAAVPVLAGRPWVFASITVLCAGPVVAAKSVGAIADPGLAAVLGVTLAVLLASQWALAAGLRGAQSAGSEQGARLQRLEELNRALSADRVALHAESRTDPLTGLANRRYLDEILNSEWNRCRRSGAALSCVLIDIDYFKAYNDRFGHDGGDACLGRIAGVLQDNSRRPGDLVARIGGEEFVVLLPETGTAGAVTVAELFKRAVSAARIPHPDSPLDGMLTISLGVATRAPDSHETPAGLLKAADLALYEAKRAGRNRVVLAGPEARGAARAAAPATRVGD